MNNEKIKKIVNKIIKILMFFQIIMMIFFIIKNGTYKPTYGDTPEYLSLAQTLKLDIYRPFIYPYTLYLLSKFISIENITYLLYPIQNAISLLSCMVLVNTLKDVMEVKLNKKEILFYSLFLFSLPLIAHYNMTLLSDSFAISYNILFISFLIKYVRTEKVGYALATLIIMFLCASTRSEKIYFLSFVIVGIIIIKLIHYLYERKRKDFKGKLNIKIIAGLSIILVLGNITTNMAKARFQNFEDVERTQSSISYILFERVVGDSLPDIYEYLPEDIKQTISYEEALESATEKNKYKKPYEKILKHDGNSKRSYTIIKTAIRRNAPKVLINVLCDFIKNIFTPYYILLNQDDEVYKYTISKMEGEHYLYTDAYVLYYDVLFIIINIYVLINKKSYKVSDKYGLVVVLLYTLVSSGFFACFTAFNFHIRYAMPIYVLENAILITLFSFNSKGEKTSNAG